MINRNSQLNNKSGNRPFLLCPVGKDYLWGGNRLNDDFTKNIDMFPLAETWECSTHPEGQSIVGSGSFEGMLLTEVLHMHPEYLGTHPKVTGELPILIKFIDAKRNLSIQVHPDDDYAHKYENGQLGKAEMWYVVDADKGANLIYGLQFDAKKEAIRGSLEDGSIEKYLQKVPVQKNDVFFIEPGTIHAIGEGVLVVEIQENSNLTYRLYDYNRVDKNGQKRELHIEKALDVANLNSSAQPAQPLRVLKYRPGVASELLGRCKYFEVHRILLNTERCRELVNYQSDSTAFRVLLCYEGCGSLSFEDDSINFFKGDCIFVPANSTEIKIHGKAQFLDICG